MLYSGGGMVGQAINNPVDGSSKGLALFLYKHVEVYEFGGDPTVVVKDTGEFLILGLS